MANMPPLRDMSFKDWFNSAYFQGATRIIVISLLPLAGYMLNEFNEHGSRLDALEKALTANAIQGEARDRAVDTAIINSASSISSISLDVIKIKEAIAGINGELRVMQGKERDANFVAVNPPLRP